MLSSFCASSPMTSASTAISTSSSSPSSSSLIGMGVDALRPREEDLFNDEEDAAASPDDEEEEAAAAAASADSAAAAMSAASGGVLAAARADANDAFNAAFISSSWAPRESWRVRMMLVERRGEVVEEEAAADDDEDVDELRGRLWDGVFTGLGRSLGRRVGSGRIPVYSLVHSSKSATSLGRAYSDGLWL